MDTKMKNSSIIVAIANAKGGVAKTSSVSAISCGLNLRGYSVLIVDLDFQANLTANFLGDKEPKNTILSLFADGKLPIFPIRESLDLIPSSASTINIEGALRGGEDYFILAEHLKRIDGKYDYIVIDCPPNVGGLTINALNACDHLLVPIGADKSSFDGLGKMAMACYQASKGTKMDGIFFTCYEPHLNITRKIEALVQKSYGPYLMKTRIRKCSKVKECMAEATDIFSYAPKCTAAQDYNNLVDEIITIVENE